MAKVVVRDVLTTTTMGMGVTCCETAAGCNAVFVTVLLLQTLLRYCIVSSATFTITSLEK